MRRLAGIAVLLVLFGGVVAADTHGGAEPDAGLVTPDSPLYAVETFLENLAVDVGLKSADSVAQERAAEARSMVENGDYEAASRAVGEVERLVDGAADTDISGLQETESMLEDIRSAVPDSSQYGFGTALDRVRSVKDGLSDNGTDTGTAADNTSADSDDAVDGCNTDTCTWDDYGCGAYDCPDGKMARGRECNDRSCETFKTRCVESAECTASPAVEEVEPHPTEDRHIRFNLSAFSASPTVSSGSVVQISNVAGDGAPHTLVIDGTAFEVSFDWMIYVRFNDTGTYAVDCRTCNASTTVTVE